MGETSVLLKPWQDRQSKKALEIKQQELGSRAFARGFKQDALSDSEKIFPHFKDCLVPGAHPRDLITREWLTVAGLDLAGTSRKGTCMVILAIAPDSSRIRVPVSVQFGAWSPKEIAQRVVDSIHVWNVRHTKIEDNSLQDAIIELITMVDPSVELSGFTTSWNKRDPEIGISSIDQEFERNLWQIADPHSEDPTCDCDYCVWKRQIQNYPAVDQADGVMATWFAREAAYELGPGIGDVAESFLSLTKDNAWGLSATPQIGRRFSWQLSTSRSRRRF